MKVAVSKVESGDGSQEADRVRSLLYGRPGKLNCKRDCYLRDRLLNVPWSSECLYPPTCVNLLHCFKMSYASKPSLSVNQVSYVARCLIYRFENAYKVLEIRHHAFD